MRQIGNAHLFRRGSKHPIFLFATVEQAAKK
jgi:hypothetical protein